MLPSRISCRLSRGLAAPGAPLARVLMLGAALAGAVFTSAGPLAPSAGAQAGPRVAARPPQDDPVRFHVSGPTQRLEMIVNTSRILTLDFAVPKILVNNTEIVRTTPLAANQIQVSALRPGVTQINMWDENDRVRTIDILVVGDARQLQDLLDSEFQEASLRVRPLANSVVVSGFVPRPEMVSRVIDVAKDYYPNVINNMTVGGAQTVLLHVKLVEVSRTKLRKAGIDWAVVVGDFFTVQGVNNLIDKAAAQGAALAGAGDSIRVGVVGAGGTFGAYIDALRQNNLAKLLTEPTLVTTSGRPASFNVGGEIPIPVSAGLGVASIEYREFGTNVDFVPIVLGDGRLRLEVRPDVTEIDSSLSVSGVPGFRSRRIDTGVEMRAGQTLVLAGLVQTRIDSEHTGVPWLMDLPYVGGAFGRIRRQANEIELLIMVTPEFVDAMDPHEVPKCGPGQRTTSPTDCELFLHRYMEVPKCGPYSCPDDDNTNPIPARDHAAHSGGAFTPAPRMFEGAPYSSREVDPEYAPRMPDQRFAPGQYDPPVKSAPPRVQPGPAQPMPMSEPLPPPQGDPRLKAPPGVKPMPTPMPMPMPTPGDEPTPMPMLQPPGGQPGATEPIAPLTGPLTRTGPRPQGAAPRYTTNARQSSYNTHSPSGRSVESRNPAQNGPPKLIGPIGYDVLK